ncbi:type IV secretion system protein [Brucella pseudogrignonensis]|uniref:type IV secretion system protein n=1 Tax=Brucella pseudogrignonensis TaxID=419475 RepID=UPI0038D035C8
MAVTAFSSMEAIMLKPVEQFISEGSSALMGHIVGPMKLAATLYIVLYGYFVLKGTIQEPAMDFVFKCMKIVIITMLATSVSDYNSYVSNFFFHTLTDEIGSALHISAPSGNPYDTIMTTALTQGLSLWKAASWGPSMVFDAVMVGIILITAVIVCIIGFIVSIYAKMALALVLVLGPVFIALALFDATRRFTESWLGQAANFVVLQILVVSLGSLLLNTLITLINGLNGENDVATAATTYAAYTLCASYLFYQLPGIASSLAAGGASLSMGSRGNHLENAASAGYSGAKWVGGKATGAAGWSVGKLKKLF